MPKLSTKGKGKQLNNTSKQNYWKQTTSIAFLCC